MDPQDLFGEVPVSEADIELWLECVCRLSLDSWRIAWYVKAYAVIDKIRAAKRAGQWPPQSSKGV